MKIVPCTVRIHSFINGQKAVYQNRGEYSLNGKETEIRYSQDASFVTLRIRPDGFVRMRRTGDCFLDLLFRKNVLTQGILGLDGEFAKREGAKKGNIPLYTEEIKYTLSEDGKSVSLYLKYVFRFDSGDQNCMVRMSATTEGSFKEFEE